MRLEPAEVPALPLAACLRDLEGGPVAATPEWAGPCPGTLSYHTGQGHLLVAPDEPAIELDGLLGRLLAALREAAAAMDGEGAWRTAVFAACWLMHHGRAADAEAAIAACVAARPGVSMSPVQRAFVRDFDRQGVRTGAPASQRQCHCRHRRGQDGLDGRQEGYGCGFPGLHRRPRRARRFALRPSGRPAGCLLHPDLGRQQSVHLRVLARQHLWLAGHGSSHGRTHS